MFIKKFLKKILGRIRGESDINKLKKMGMKVGSNFNCAGKCTFDYSHCFLISIGDNVTFSARVHILAHDASTRRELGYTKIGLVTIGSNVFVGENTTILPGVSVCDNVIIGANSLVSKSLDANGVYAGCPARFICSYKDYMDKNQNLMNDKNMFDESYTLRGNISEDKKKEMI